MPEIVGLLAGTALPFSLETLFFHTSFPHAQSSISHLFFFSFSSPRQALPRSFHGSFTVLPSYSGSSSPVFASGPKREGSSTLLPSCQIHLSLTPLFFFDLCFFFFLWRTLFPPGALVIRSPEWGFQLCACFPQPPSVIPHVSFVLFLTRSFRAIRPGT